MADITANVDAWSTTEASNAPSGSTSIGTGLDDNLRALAAGVKVWTGRLPLDQGVINGRITASVASNALTIALKGKDGNDPSSTNKVYIPFRSGTASSSDWNIREVTSALSVVVSSGSTLGHASGIVQHFFVYAIDNAGTVELAVSNLPPDYPGTFLGQRLISTTAEGGAGGADSATGIYSTTARSNVPWVCLAMCKSNQTTAGTWASVPTQIDMAPFTIPTNAFSAYRSADVGGIANATFVKATHDAEVFDFDGVFDAATNNRFQPNVAGIYVIQHSDQFGSLVDPSRCISSLFKNGSEHKRGSDYISGGNSDAGGSGGAVVIANGTSDYFEHYVYQGSGGARTLKGGDSVTWFAGQRISS